MSAYPERFIFAGTPDFAAASLAAMIAHGHVPVAVYTQPDRPAGRGRQLLASPVKQLALAHGIPVCQPERLRSAEAQAELAAWQPDLMVVAAYGLILPKTVLEIPRFGCINVHASLLPRWRGAAPIQRTIAAGDTETGITIMQMDVGLDTGDMLLKRVTPIHADDTGGSLHDRLAVLGGDALIDALRAYRETPLIATPQDDTLSCYAAKLSKEEGVLDWQLAATALERRIRAFTPWPGSFTLDQGQTLRVHHALLAEGRANAVPGQILRRDRHGIVVACGDGALSLQTLQLPGSRAMAVADLINGGKPVLALGSVLSSAIPT